ncbi:hypothetical protein P4U99_00830 [Brevibacillus agri]|uniref:hypothetical protein n=1 Tax=Brevibacillus TaxID=55080 RepID=UPI000271A299|nr:MULTISPECIES: hypothetical protein [Brevibacillus]EJL39001.1 hypothetical protein PMI08_05219 [Brevibacillus sp. CF112]MBG9566066.1 hypothetical protein [Brevibacillus agri]MBY0051042.1 hypothetical protein [Brevibacillus agri]MED1641755.1 hypothetical protein [Brevibacillus agri]MED1654375.1 hypothetical protein [Brevibacillus agri]
MLNVGVSAIPLLIMLLFYGLIIYLIFSLIRFMKNKTSLDRERNEKLDQLIQLLQQQEQKTAQARSETDRN